MDSRKSAKREQAEKRQAASAALSPKERLAKLDSVLGPGQGAVKERARLAVLIEQQATPPKAKDKA